MAGSSFFALLDDIATILDDVTIMSKVAVKKTSGVLGDDLALNAQQVTGVSPDRELPVVWAVAKGSLVNKCILVPAALAISLLLPSAISPLLMLGGLFLCYEGCEKLAHKFFTDRSAKKAHHDELVKAIADPQIDMVAFENKKIKGAVRTDFILSAEIIVITLGTMTEATFGLQVATLIVIAILMTVGVYGLVAGIVKLDDAGLNLISYSGRDIWSNTRRGLGQLIIWIAPKLMKTLSVVGTAAMFMVGGGILVHGLGPVHHAIEAWSSAVASIPNIGGLLGMIVSITLEAGFGILCGSLAVLAHLGFTKMRR